MSITATVAAFQTLHLTISGVVTAPTALPGSVNEVELPLALTKPDEATWVEQAIGLKRQNRIYVVFCLVAPVALGKDMPDTGFKACLPLLQAFGETYLSHRTLNGAVDHLDNIRDGGVEILTYAGINYHGFVFHVDTVEK